MTDADFKKMKEVINELIAQHNGLVHKVDEIVSHINNINTALFEDVEKPDQLDS